METPPCSLSVEDHRMLLPVRNIPRKPNKTRRRGGNLLGNTIFLLRTAVCLWQMINASVSLTVHNISSTCHRVLRSGPWLCPHRGKKSDLRSPQSQWKTNVHGSRTKQLGSASCPGLCKSGNCAFNLLTCKTAKWYSYKPNLWFLWRIKKGKESISLESLSPICKEMCLTFPHNTSLLTITVNLTVNESCGKNGSINMHAFNANTKNVNFNGMF